MKNLAKKKFTKKKPFFSIITVVKNDENNITKTIKSVQNQSFKNLGGMPKWGRWYLTK